MHIVSKVKASTELTVNSAPPPPVPRATFPSGSLPSLVFISRVQRFQSLVPPTNFLPGHMRTPPPTLCSLHPAPVLTSCKGTGALVHPHTASLPAPGLCFLKGVRASFGCLVLCVLPADLPPNCPQGKPPPNPSSTAGNSRGACFLLHCQNGCSTHGHPKAIQVPSILGANRVEAGFTLLRHPLGCSPTSL